MVDVDLNKVEPWDLPSESLSLSPAPLLNRVLILIHNRLACSHAPLAGVDTEREREREIRAMQPVDLISICYCYPQSDAHCLCCAYLHTINLGKIYP